MLLRMGMGIGMEVEFFYILLNEDFDMIEELFFVFFNFCGLV